MINLDDKANWCLSGGAIGSDLAWGVAAAAVGHGVIHFSFQGHQTLAPPEQVVRLTAEQLASADEPCRRANQTLRRRFPARSQRTRVSCKASGRAKSACATRSAVVRSPPAARSCAR